MAEDKLFYYQVALGLDGTWKQATYTYHAERQLEVGAVVQAPFGKASKLGYVVSATTKPSMKTKSLEYISDGLVLQAAQRNFLHWLNGYYPGTPGLHTQYALPAYIKKLPELTQKQNQHTQKLPPLTDTQQQAVHEIEESSSAVILHGTTGSGKTRVYAELIKSTLQDGKSVLLLYPEISLTSQLTATLGDYFGEESLSIFHSKQTPKQQRESWQTVMTSAEPQIVIGPRSSLFAPHRSLGLVVVDEAHDGAYKQDSGSRYHGIVAASALSKAHGALLVIGSATPPVAETQQILSKGGKLVCMHSLARGETNRTFEIVDMTKQDNHSSQVHLLSKQLVSVMKSTLERGEQSLLFLNRRGTARNIICVHCGWHATCRDCEMPLTFHHDSFKLICHVCGFSESAPVSCPDCGKSITQKTPGTKAIEQELARLFPHARIGRYDSDNKKADSFTVNYQQIADGDVDILLGTQLLTKGLDLPKLSTVGILQADGALNLPDYNSSERAFQQLTQVSGRVGRGHSHGHVIVQTYQADNPIFDYVTAQDWHAFYDLELASRKATTYPPYAYILKIWVQKPSDAVAQKAIAKIADDLRSKPVKVLGPAPSFYGKVGGKYSWQLIVLSKSRKILSDFSNDLPKDSLHDLDPTSLL